MKLKPAFSLIELLVTIGIMALLVTAVVFSTENTRIRSRDANRRESVTGYQTALEQYRIARGTYLVKNAAGNAAGGLATGEGPITYEGPTLPLVTGASIADALLNQGFLTQIHTDPLAAPPFGDPAHDFYLALCETSSGPAATLATTVDTATEYAIYADLEQPSTAESAEASTHLCPLPSSPTFSVNYGVGSARWGR